MGSVGENEGADVAAEGEGAVEAGVDVVVHAGAHAYVGEYAAEGANVAKDANVGAGADAAVGEASFAHFDAAAAAGRYARGAGFATG